MDFERRGHTEKGYGYKADRRHLLGIGPKKDAASLLSGLPVPKAPGGLDEAAIRSLGILDQGGAPFCVGHGTAGGVRDCVQRNGNPAPKLGSRLWLMYLAHAIEHDVDGFDGAFVGDAFEVLERLGIPPEDAWPYSDSPAGPYKVMPPADVFRQAFDQLAPLDYGRIMSHGAARVNDVMKALAYGGKGGKPCPVVFGTDVTTAYASNQLGPGFLADKPDPADVDGGHCQRIIRFEFDPGVVGGVKFRVVNSWGPGWADRGMCWITPAYLTDPSTEDLWMGDYQGMRP